jgi:hypothetical protein
MGAQRSQVRRRRHGDPGGAAVAKAIGMSAPSRPGQGRQSSRRSAVARIRAARARGASNKGPINRLYSASTTLCCAHALSEGGEQVLGAQAGEARLAEVFAEAGFGHWRVASETPVNLVLEAWA